MYVSSKIFIFLLLKTAYDTNIFIFTSHLRQTNAAFFFLKQIDHRQDNLKLVINSIRLIHKI